LFGFLFILLVPKEDGFEMMNAVAIDRFQIKLLSLLRLIARKHPSIVKAVNTTFIIRDNKELLPVFLLVAIALMYRFVFFLIDAFIQK